MLVELKRRLRALIIDWLELHPEQAGRTPQNSEQVHLKVSELQDRVDRLEHALADRFGAGLDKRIAAASREGIPRTDELQLRLFALQRLVVGSPSARPPGAREAVAKLGNPAVAVILPTYNRARFVGEAIASVQAQSFPAWELVIVDDGSSDETEHAVAPFLGDPRIRYIRQQNTGSSVARNRGLDETSAPLVAYLDSDNTWYPDFLALAVDQLAVHTEVDFVYGALVTFLHNLPSACILWEPFDRARLEVGNFIDTNVLVHRRELVARYGGWDPNLSRLNDWDFALRCTVDKPAHALNALAAYYRQVDDIRVSETIDAEKEQQIIRAKLSRAKTTDSIPVAS
ncbi:glycosyltransferase family A protein [Rhodopseudomonas palustris]|uniref:Glycosyltransferase family 2 protein n=1 Tax=Rhodopseudomonas palustris TaxID=1076 RepID=A0A418V3Z7_RHOPL|nr:glycosyltransferase family A protein [Rhodopseudomonas palustris]RJF70796.1 glycosyltransferase family 2 protein [Rhodopseudomonas palustris]